MTTRSISSSVSVTHNMSAIYYRISLKLLLVSSLNHKGTSTPDEEPHVFHSKDAFSNLLQYSHGFSRYNALNTHITFTGKYF